MANKSKSENASLTGKMKMSDIDTAKYDPHVHKYNPKKILEWYACPTDGLMNRGWLGHMFILWAITLSAFAVGVITDTLKYSFIFPIVALSIEAGVVVISHGVLCYLGYRAARDLKSVVRGEADVNTPVKYNISARSLRSRYNVAADGRLISAALPFVIIQVIILVILATGVTDNLGVRIPYYNAIAPKTAAQINAIYVAAVNEIAFTASDFLRFILHFLDVIKYGIVLGIAMDMESFWEKKAKLEKLYMSRDAAGGAKTMEDGDRRDYTAEGKNGVPMIALDSVA